MNRQIREELAKEIPKTDKGVQFTYEVEKHDKGFQTLLQDKQKEKETKEILKMIVDLNSVP